nr:RnaseH [Ipomoea batatas]
MGMQCVKSKGYENCEIQIDSKEIADFMHAALTIGHHQDTIMEHLKKMNIEGGCKIVHVYREQNQVADELAKLALCGETDWIEFYKPPPGCKRRVCNDLMGVSELSGLTISSFVFCLAKLVYSTTLVSNSCNNAVALFTAVCSSASSVLSESILSNTFFLLINLNCGAALWNPVTRSISPTRVGGESRDTVTGFTGSWGRNSKYPMLGMMVYETSDGGDIGFNTSNNHVKIFGVGPNPLDNPFPILTFTLSGYELSQLLVGFQDLSNAVPDGSLSDIRV